MAIQPTAFGLLLKRFRGRAGLTQEALADRAGLSLQTITKLERGIHRVPRTETVQVLACSLHLAPHERAHLERAALRPPAVGTTDGCETVHAALTAVLQALTRVDLGSDRPPLIDVFVSAHPDAHVARDQATVRVTIL